MKPLVSIIVPVYNTEKYLEECLRSIISQTYNNVEIIIINDGSIDQSPKICKRFSELDNRINYISQTNCGVSETRNKGIQNASGEYLMFVDSDDILEPDMVESLVNCIMINRSDFVICGNFNLSTLTKAERHLFSSNVIFEKEKNREEILVPTLGPSPLKFDPAKIDKLTPIWARLYKTTIIKENNIQFIDLNKLPSECLQFNFEYTLKINKTVYLDKPLYSYRRNTISSVTKPFREDLTNKWLWWINYINRSFSIIESEQALKDALNGRIICSLIPLGGNALKIKNRKKRKEEFKNILYTNEIQAALSDFSTRNSAFYWRLFFFSAQKKNVTLFMFLTWCMRKILKLRKS